MTSALQRGGLYPEYSILTLDPKWVPFQALNGTTKIWDLVSWQSKSVLPMSVNNSPEEGRVEKAMSTGAEPAGYRGVVIEWWPGSNPSSYWMQDNTSGTEFSEPQFPHLTWSE
jgi:hypothetical protein